MTRDELKAMLADYLGDELDGDRKREFEAAVASDPEFDRAFESVVRQFESTWSTRAQSTNQIIELGDMMIMQILDRFGVDEAIEQAEPYDVMPDSFDELAPPVPTEDDVEDL